MSVYGTGINTPPAQLTNTLSATTQKHIVPVLGDNVFKPSPLFWGLSRRGKKFASGAAIIYPLVNQEETTGGSYYGDQLLNTATVDSVTPAEQQWKFYYQSLSLPITDIIINRGAPLDLLKSKFEIASASFLQKLCRAIWHTSPQNTTMDIDDLPSWVKTTNNTIAGIDRTVSTWFQPAANVANGGGNLSVASVENAYQSVVKGFDEPDLLVMDNTRFGKFKQNFIGAASATVIRANENIQDKDALQMGFRYHFMYNNAVVLADLFANAQEAYLLNSKYLFPVFHSADYFKVDPWIKPSNQRVVTSNMYATWNLSCPGPSFQACITGIA